MALYNVIQNYTNKYIPYYILPEPTITYVYSSKPIAKSIQKVQQETQIFLNSLTSDDIIIDNNENNSHCELVYIRVKRTETNSGSEWKQIIQKS